MIQTRRRRTSDTTWRGLVASGKAQVVLPTTDSGYLSYGAGRLFLPAATNYAQSPRFRRDTNDDGLADFFSDGHTTATAPQYTTSTFSDKFTRSDRNLNGDTADTGQTWKVTASGGAESDEVATITSNGFISSETAYASVVLAAHPKWIGGKFAFTPSGGALDSTMAMILSSDGQILPDLNHMLHLQWSYHGATLSWWDYPSQANVIASWTFSSDLAKDGTIYSIGMTVDGSTVTIDLPDGTTKTVVDSHVPAVSGSLCIWEVYWPSATVCSIGRWESVGAGDREQRFVYTGAAGDSNALLVPCQTSAPDTFAAGDPLTVSALLSSKTGCTGVGVYFRGMSNATGGAAVSTAQTAALTLTTIPTRYTVSIASCAATTNYATSDIAVTGISEGDTADVSMSDLIITKQPFLSGYFDGTSPFCAWTITTDVGTSTRAASVLKVPFQLADAAGTIGWRIAPLFPNGGFPSASPHIVDALNHACRMTSGMRLAGHAVLGGTASAILSGSATWAAGSSHSAVVRWSATTHDVTSDGTAAAQVSRTGTGAPVSPLSIGGTVAGGLQANAYLGSMFLCPSRVTDAETATLCAMLTAGVTGTDLFRFFRDKGYSGTLIIPLDGDSCAYKVA